VTNSTSVGKLSRTTARAHCVRCGIRRPSHQRRYASGAVVDAMDPDCLGLVVNPMEQPVGATACADEFAATVTYLRRPGEKPYGGVKG
jgi:hypothetical protein